MGYFKEHSKKDVENSKKIPISFPSKNELLVEIEIGMTSKFVNDRVHLANSIYKSYGKEIKHKMAMIKKSPIPSNIDEGDWKVLSNITSEAKKYCPLSDNLKAVCSMRFGFELRLVYEVYEYNGIQKVLFTNLNIHIYRNRLYTDSSVICNYRNNIYLDN